MSSINMHSDSEHEYSDYDADMSEPDSSSDNEHSSNSNESLLSGESPADSPDEAESPEASPKSDDDDDDDDLDDPANYLMPCEGADLLDGIFDMDEYEADSCIKDISFCYCEQCQDIREDEKVKENELRADWINSKIPPHNL